MSQCVNKIIMLTTGKSKQFVKSFFIPGRKARQMYHVHRSQSVNAVCTRNLVTYRRNLVDVSIDPFLLHTFPKERAEGLRYMSFLRPVRNRSATA